MILRHFFLQYEPGHGTEFRALLDAWREYAMARIPKQPGAIARLSGSVDVEDTAAGRIRVEMSDAGYVNFVAFARTRGWKAFNEASDGTALTTFSHDA